MRAARLALVAVIATGLYAPEAHAGKFGDKMRSIGSKIAGLFKKSAPDEAKARAAFERYQQTGKKRDFRIMTKNSAFLKDAYKFHLRNKVVEKVVGVDPQTGQKVSEPQVVKTHIGRARFFKALGIATMIAPIPVVGKAVGLTMIGGAQLKINGIKKNARAATLEEAGHYFQQKDAEAALAQTATNKAVKAKTEKALKKTRENKGTRKTKAAKALDKVHDKKVAEKTQIEQPPAG